MSALGEVDRSLDAIKDAARRIELPEMRVFYSFFWFRTGDAVDDLALECLSNFELSEADSIWGKQIEKVDDLGKPTWRINRAVFSLWMSDDLELGTAHFEQALEDIGFVTDDLYEEAINDVLGADQLSAEHIRELVADALVSHAIKSPGQVYGPNAIQLIEHCWSFHIDTKDYIKSRVTKPLINVIQDREWLLEQRRRTLTWDPDYSDEDDDDFSDSESDLEEQRAEGSAEEVDDPLPPKRVPKGSTMCPLCKKKFEPDEVIAYTDLGVRCPFCSQSIMLW